MKGFLKSVVLVGLMGLMSACGYSDKEKAVYSSGYEMGAYCKEKGKDISAEDAYIIETTLRDGRRSYVIDDCKGAYKAGFKDGIKGKRRKY